MLLETADCASGFHVCIDTEAFAGGHMWTAPIGKRFFAVTNDLVSIGHMSGLLVRAQ
jgi:hypothetical protein